MSSVVRCFALSALLITATAGTAQDKPKAGDIVWAEWRVNDWYHGKVAKVDDNGFHIAFDDGDKAVVASSKIAIDREPKKDEVKVNTRVLAKFKNLRFFPGKISDIRDDGTYDIKFDDGDVDVLKLSQLRLISK